MQLITNEQVPTRISDFREFASNWSFARHISVSNGFLMGTQWDKRDNPRPLSIETKTVVGAMDHYPVSYVPPTDNKNEEIPEEILQEKSEKQLQAKAGNANPHTVDFCTLQDNEDTVCLKFNMQVNGPITINSCDQPKVIKFTNEFLNAFKENGGFSDLALKYAMNIANARYLWRNRIGVEAIEVIVQHNDELMIFDGLEYPLRNMENFLSGRTDDKQLFRLAELIEDALSGKTEFCNLSIMVYAKKYPGAEVFPSQEFVQTSDDNKKGSKSKELFVAKMNERYDKVAAFHPQKITNAIHTIDEWYKDYNENYRIPLNINSYASNSRFNSVYRPKDHFFKLWKDITKYGPEYKFNKFEHINSDEDIKNIYKFIVAMFIRGGVFGYISNSEKEKLKKKPNDKKEDKNKNNNSKQE